MIRTMIRKIRPQGMLALLLALIFLGTALFLTACTGERGGQTDTTVETESQAVTDPLESETDSQESETNKPAEEETTMYPETESQPAEIFAPDPEHAVPRFDAIMSDLDSFPLSFSYDGTEYRGFSGFTTVSSVSVPNERGIETTVTLRHPDIPLLFRLVARVYPAESAYEYVVYIDNDGNTDSGVISSLVYNLEFKGDNPTLSGLSGDAGGCYTPYSIDLKKKRTVNHTSTNGRPTHGVFPYYNLSYGDGGTFIAIGWPGTWSASFLADREKVSLTAGQYKVSTYIKPGETLRMPLMGFVEYENLTPDEQTNAWRHYFINDVMRKPDGENTPTTIGISTMSQGMTTKKMQMILKSYAAHDIPIESLWIDAGWYTGAAGESVAWPSTGTQDVDLTRFPDSMATIGQFCADHDMKFLLWFEPENVRLDKATFVANQEGFREEWLLDKTLVGTWLEGYLLNLGDPDCRAWVFNKICTVMDTAGVNIYRQDFNNDPASAWAAADGINRTGMTENQYVQGYLALWDALIERYPSIIIDSCASGGGRNDLETMHRAVPLHYSDWFDGNNEDYDMKGRMTQALYAWFPYFKNQCYQLTSYKMRMNYAPWSLLQVPSAISKDANWELLRQGYVEYEQVRGYFYADYYQLVEYTTEKDRWNAWEFYDPATASGYASIACQPDSTQLSRTVCLKGLDANKTYTVTDFDGLVSVTASGQELMQNGIQITVPEQPYCVILLIKGQ